MIFSVSNSTPKRGDTFVVHIEDPGTGDNGISHYVKISNSYREYETAGELLSSASVTLTDDWLGSNIIPGTNVPLYVEVRRYNAFLDVNTTEYGNYIIVVPETEDNQPSVTGLDYSVIRDYDEKFGLISGRFKLRISFSANPGVARTVKSLMVEAGGSTYTPNISIGGGNVTMETGYITASSSTINIRVYLTNSSDATASAGTTVYGIQQYTTPRLENIVCERCDSGGNSMAAGEYLYLYYDAVYSYLSGENYPTVSILYQKENGTTTRYTGDVTGEGQIISDIVTDPASKYRIILTVSDEFGGQNSYEFNLKSIYRLVHLRRGGDGIAFGKTATQSGFECDMPAQFDQPVTLENTTINGIEIIPTNTTPMTGLAFKITGDTLFVKLELDSRNGLIISYGDPSTGRTTKSRTISW